MTLLDAATSILAALDDAKIGTDYRTTRGLLTAIDELRASCADALVAQIETPTPGIGHIPTREALARILGATGQDGTALVEAAARVAYERDELRAHPLVTVIADRATEERAVEAERQRDEARAERDDYVARYKVAMENGLRVIAERDEALQGARGWSDEAIRRGGERDAARTEADQCRRERDEAKARARHATQLVIEAIGSVGPESVEDAVPRALAALAEARRERDAARKDAKGLREAVSRLRSTSWPAERRDIAIREAEERGARWALDRAAQAAGDGVDALRAERICDSARKVGSDE